MSGMIFKSVALLMFLLLSSRCDDVDDDDDVCVEGLSLRQKRAFEVRRSDDAQTMELLQGKHLSGIEAGVDKKEEECDALELNRTLSAIQVGMWDTVKSSACRDHDAVLSVLELQDDNLDAEDLFEIAPKYEQDRSAEQGSCKDKLLLPKVLLIGLNRAGSTTIAELMNSHPNMSWGNIKEHYWLFQGLEYSILNRAPEGPRHNCTHCRTVAEYTKEFQVSCNINMTFDASPQTWLLGHKDLSFLKLWAPDGQYIGMGSTAMQNIKTLLGNDVKIIMTLKDPVLWMNSNGVFNNWTEQYRYAEEMMCVADSLETWLEVIPRDNFLFLDSATMFHNLQETMDSVLKFVGMPAHDYSNMLPLKAGRRRTPRYYTEEGRKSYHEDPKHKACQDRLSKQTGLTFDW